MLGIGLVVTVVGVEGNQKTELVVDATKESGSKISWRKNRTEIQFSEDV